MSKLRNFRDERDAKAVRSLEKFDEAKETAEKAAFAKQGVVGPKPAVAQFAGAEVCPVYSLYPRSGRTVAYGEVPRKRISRVTKAK
jgi:hypothetical protein